MGLYIFLDRIKQVLGISIYSGNSNHKASTRRQITEPLREIANAVLGK